MAFPPSAEKALLGLANSGSKQVLYAIKGIVTTATASLNVTKLQKAAIATAIEVSLIPLTAQQVVLEKAISTVKQSAQIVPKTVTDIAPELGMINQVVSASLGGTIEAAEGVLFKINSLKAAAKGVTAEIGVLDAQLKFFTDLEKAIDKVLGA